MFGINGIIDSKNISPAVIERWQRRYGKELYFDEFEGKKAYLRTPTEKELKKLLKDISRPGRAIEKEIFIKCILKIVWLGGDSELLTNKGFHEKMKNIWQTL